MSVSSATKPRKEKGIIMQGHNVLAMIRPESPKTQTRRLITVPKFARVHGRSPDWSKVWIEDKPTIFGEYYIRVAFGGGDYGDEELQARCYPRYEVGDVLYIKEGFKVYEDRICTKYSNEEVGYFLEYLADGVSMEIDYSEITERRLSPGRTYSPLFLSKWATRPNRFLVESVRAERLQDITEEDAIAEGIQVGRYDNGQVYYYVDNPADHESSAKKSFLALWDSINTKPGTRSADNPMVFAYTFKEVSQ